jgi:8-oxo-dGTP diphosphatase
VAIKGSEWHYRERPRWRPIALSSIRWGVCGSHALPGGFVKVGETVEDACRREVREETSVELNELALVGVYSDLNRDPRGHIVGIAYTSRLPSDVLPRAGSDATSAEWVDTSQVTLGLDHAQILADAKAKIFSHIRSEGHDAQADH